MSAWSRLYSRSEQGPSCVYLKVGQSHCRNGSSSHARNSAIWKKSGDSILLVVGIPFCSAAVISWQILTNLAEVFFFHMIWLMQVPRYSAAAAKLSDVTASVPKASTNGNRPLAPLSEILLVRIPWSFSQKIAYHPNTPKEKPMCCPSWHRHDMPGTC